MSVRNKIRRGLHRALSREADEMVLTRKVETGVDDSTGRMGYGTPLTQNVLVMPLRSEGTLRDGVVMEESEVLILALDPDGYELTLVPNEDDTLNYPDEDVRIGKNRRIMRGTSDPVAYICTLKE